MVVAVPIAVIVGDDRLEPVAAERPRINPGMARPSKTRVILRPSPRLGAPAIDVGTCRTFRPRAWAHTPGLLLSAVR